jgi:hypothetical protein
MSGFQDNFNNTNFEPGLAFMVEYTGTMPPVMFAMSGDNLWAKEFIGADAIFDDGGNKLAVFTYDTMDTLMKNVHLDSGTAGASNTEVIILTNIDGGTQPTIITRAFWGSYDHLNMAGHTISPMVILWNATFRDNGATMTDTVMSLNMATSLSRAFAPIIVPVNANADITWSITSQTPSGTIQILPSGNTLTCQVTALQVGNATVRARATVHGVNIDATGTVNVAATGNRVFGRELFYNSAGLDMNDWDAGNNWWGMLRHPGTGDQGHGVTGEYELDEINDNNAIYITMADNAGAAEIRIHIGFQWTDPNDHPVGQIDPHEFFGTGTDPGVNDQNIAVFRLQDYGHSWDAFIDDGEAIWIYTTVSGDNDEVLIHKIEIGPWPAP